MVSLANVDLRICTRVEDLDIVIMIVMMIVILIVMLITIIITIRIMMMIVINITINILIVMLITIVIVRMIAIMIFFTGWSFGWASSSQVVTFSTEQSVKQISDDITTKSENVKCLTYGILPKLFLQLVCWVCRYCWRKCSFIIEQMQDTDILLKYLFFDD